MPKSNPTLSVLSWRAVDSIASSRTIVGHDDADDGGDHRMTVMGRPEGHQRNEWYKTRRARLSWRIHRKRERVCTRSQLRELGGVKTQEEKKRHLTNSGVQMHLHDRKASDGGCRLSEEPSDQGTVVKTGLSLTWLCKDSLRFWHAPALDGA